MSGLPPTTTLEIVVERDGFVVVNKPPGLLSVPGKGEDKQDCVISRVRAMFNRAAGPMIVHRLDMDTSGLLVVALTADMQRLLSREFEERRVKKKYTALLDGHVEHATEGTVNAALRLDPDNRPWQVHDFIHGREAITNWRVLSYETDRTRVEMEPLTGRTHQLRMHAALPRPIGIGHPILGDVLYGRADSAPRLMLHAGELEFVDPVSGERIAAKSHAGF